MALEIGRRTVQMGTKVLLVNFTSEWIRSQVLRHLKSGSLLGYSHDTDDLSNGVEICGPGLTKELLTEFLRKTPCPTVSQWEFKITEIGSDGLPAKKEGPNFLVPPGHTMWTLGFTNNQIRNSVSESLKDVKDLNVYKDPACKYRRLYVSAVDLTEDQVVDLVRNLTPDGKHIHFLVNKAR